MGIFVWPSLLAALGVERHGLSADFDLAFFEKAVTMAVPFQHLVQELLHILRNQLLTPGLQSAS